MIITVFALKVTEPVMVESKKVAKKPGSTCKV